MMINIRDGHAGAGKCANRAYIREYCMYAPICGFAHRCTMCIAHRKTKKWCMAIPYWYTSDKQTKSNICTINCENLENTHLTLSCITVPLEIGPAPTLALLPSHGEVGVADEVHVHGLAGQGGGAVLEWLEAGGSWRWLLTP